MVLLFLCYHYSIFYFVDFFFMPNCIILFSFSQIKERNWRTQTRRVYFMSGEKNSLFNFCSPGIWLFGRVSDRIKIEFKSYILRTERKLQFPRVFVNYFFRGKSDYIFFLSYTSLHSFPIQIPLKLFFYSKSCIVLKRRWFNIFSQTQFRCVKFLT